MEWVIIGLGLLLAVAGVAGSLLPALPGPPIAFAGLWLQQLREPNPFTTKFLLIWGGLTLVTMILDYYVPIWGTKRFGGTKYGVWGCTIGFLAAFWLGPWGVILGPFVGAFLGELLARQHTHHAFRAAVGSFVGFLAGSFLKLLVCFFMIYYIVASI